jgi:hypothetical protein
VNTRPCRGRAARLDPELMGRVLDTLLDTLSPAPADGAPDTPGPATAIGLGGTDAESIEIMLRELPGDDPVRQLFGFTAPSGWSACGVIATGRARPLDPLRADGVMPPERVHFGVLVSRAGDQVMAVRGRDQPDVHGRDQPDVRGHGTHVHRFDADAIDGPGGGRIPDACRRVLGLPTPAPASDTCELWALLWVEAVLRRSLTEARTLSWPDVVGEFPSYRFVAEGDPPLANLLDEHLVELGRASARAWPWAQLLRSCRQGKLSGFGVDATDADWMDEGMFSREVLGNLPPLDVLLSDLDCLLDSEVAVPLERTLVAWGIR